MKKHCRFSIVLVLASALTTQVPRASTMVGNNVPGSYSAPGYYLELRDASLSSTLLMVAAVEGRKATTVGGYQMGRTTVTIAAKSLDEALGRLQVLAPVPVRQEDRGSDGVWFLLDTSQGSQDRQKRYLAHLEHLDAEYNALSRLKGERLTHPERFARVAEDTMYLRTAGIVLRPKRCAIIEYGTPPFVEQGFGLQEGHGLGPDGANMVIRRITRAGVYLRSQDGRRQFFAPFRFSTAQERKQHPISQDPERTAN